jgi:16S rRNA (cytosine967-C5)-methyltransferase
MKNLLKNLGALDYVDIAIADSRHPPHNKLFDKILLDAPCSSSGSISKDPAIRLHLLKRGKIEYYSTLQYELLDKALDLAKEVVYSTCSILPEEGEEVVENVRNKAKPIDPGIKASKGYSRYSVGNTVARFFPHMHMSEGFFIAKLISMKSI